MKAGTQKSKPLIDSLCLYMKELNEQELQIYD